MPHIEQLEHLAIAVGPSGLIALGNLPPTGDTRLHAQELIACIPELVRLLYRYRSGTDNRELTSQYIDKLRQLIERCLAKNLTHSGNTRIIVDLLLAFPLRQLLWI